MATQTVLEYLEEGKIDDKISVERTSTSKWCFFTLVRHYRQKTKLRPNFVSYSKAEEARIRAKTEEFSLLDDRELLVMEGAPESFIANLSPPKGTIIIAETEGGTLKVPSFSPRIRRDLLRILVKQVAPNYSLRALLQLDWSDCRSYEDHEIILRRAVAADLSEIQVATLLNENPFTHILKLLRKGPKKELLALKERYGAIWTYNHLVEILSQLVHYRTLHMMGYDDAMIGRQLELSKSRREELEEAMKMYSPADMLILINRILKIDKVILTKRELALDLLLLYSGVEVGL